jgi:imidazolonepropionase-like amidohydrolase
MNTLRRLRWLFTLAACTIAASVFAESLALVGGKIHTAPGVAAIADGVVVVDGERIAAVGPRGSVAVPAGARVLDCSGGAITAGFWNSHVHFIAGPFLDAARRDRASLQGELDRMLNRWGFTTVFDLASPLANTQALRDRIASAELRGPRILTVGEPLWTRAPVYVARYLEENGIAMPVVRDAPDARARVERQAAAGADGIKLFTGSVQAGGVENMPREIAAAAVRVAHARGLPVFSHAQDQAGLDAALAAGVDVIAHPVVERGSASERARRLYDAHAALIPTLTLFEYERVPERLVGAVLEEVRALAAAGGELLFGTDVGYTDRYDTTREFELMARAGLTFDQVLASLTTNPARRFGHGTRTGRIVPGEPADLVVLQVDPAGDPAALSKVRLTIRGGAIVFGAVTP